MSYQSPDKFKALLGDLGKPTLRGIRKCPKCGTYNGTRGIVCKNKACHTVFKERAKKKGHSAEAVKIITGSQLQVVSVRLRDRGPDYRGFIQLPLVQDMDGNITENVDATVLAQGARCYVENCHRNSDLKGALPCAHIKAAVGCNDEAQPLTLKNSVLNSLNASSEIKQAIWHLATETNGPLVQRVTKNIMVVKCKPTQKQSLGFLHFAFFETSRNRSSSEHKFQCSCRAFKVVKPGAKEDTQKRCVHFYACICAFASDDILSEEFSYYINLDTANPSPGTQVFTVFSPTGDPNLPGDSEAVEIVISDDPTGALLLPAKRARGEDDVAEAQASSALLTLQEGVASPKKTSPLKAAIPKLAQTPKKTALMALEEANVSLDFLHWLASVTERVNQTMHFQFDGNPEPLVFHSPQVFFDCLQWRISAGQKKRRLPNSTTGFVRKDALPLGTFTKYSWHITNILHVKQIFDTPEMPLDITRSFVENRDGTYDLYETPKVAVENIDDQFRGRNQPPIRPLELRTFLKVGNTSPDQKDPTPFIIEWIPDILPKSHIGELRIKFEYGHQRNGLIEHRLPQSWTPSPPIELQTIQVQQVD